jgi:hypothetical protein
VKFRLLITFVSLVPALALAQFGQSMPPNPAVTQQNQMIREGQSAYQSGSIGDSESKKSSSKSASTYKSVEICTDGKCITISCSSADMQTNYCD